MNHATPPVRFTVSGEVLLRLWADEAVLYHCPSATTLRLSPPLGAALECLRQSPATIRELHRRIAAIFPGTDDLEAHLQEGLERLRREGILRADETDARLA